MCGRIRCPFPPQAELGLEPCGHRSGPFFGFGAAWPKLRRFWAIFRAFLGNIVALCHWKTRPIAACVIRFLLLAVYNGFWGCFGQQMAVFGSSGTFPVEHPPTQLLLT